MNTQWIAYCLITVVLIFLSSCSHTQTTDVDQLSLVRSMVYTQRHLLEMELTENRELARYEPLVASYCDLIDRGAISVSMLPTQCDFIDTNTKFCSATFHRCISACNMRSGLCKTCEAQASMCLAVE